MGTSASKASIRSANSVHPHVRGDVGHVVGETPQYPGPPPRAWGRRPVGRLPGVAERSTPTCVGTSKPNASACSSTTVHPHVRGDVRTRPRPSLRFGGPPPRAWGRLTHWEMSVHVTGSTPTCVGTSIRSPQSPPPGSVHPHVRGDVVKPYRGYVASGGPPPRAWGRPDGVPWASRKAGSTPTCVGTSSPSTESSTTTRVHPHVRGDVDGAGVGGVRSQGPPPRAWGRRWCGGWSGPAAGSTPTCVGTSRDGQTPPADAGVHPHVRGDVELRDDISERGLGPPPRAWGRRWSLRTLLSRSRSTPTCVGTSSCRWRPPTPGLVHPHVRGDV